MQQLITEALPLLSQLFAATPEHVYIIDNDRNFVFANNTGPQLLGMTADDFMGKNWNNIGLDPVAVNAIDAKIDEVSETGAPFCGELSYPLPDTVGWFSYCLSPIRDGRKIVATLLIVRDITQEKTMKREVQALQSLLPICCYCKNIRDDQGYWERVEDYFSGHRISNFSHGVCPTCAVDHEETE